MKIYLASDHAGFELKEQIKVHLKEQNFEVEDIGPFAYEPDDDYPDFVIPAARKVAEDPERNRGIVLGGSGQGEAIAANKVQGVLAAHYYGGPLEIIELSRRHNDSNLLSLGARFIDKDLAFKAIDLWLRTPFDGGRHVRRIGKIKAMEERI